MPEKFKLFKWLEDVKHIKLELPWLPLFPHSSAKGDEIFGQAALRLIDQHDATRLSRPRLHTDKRQQTECNSQSAAHQRSSSEVCAGRSIAPSMN